MSPRLRSHLLLAANLLLLAWMPSLNGIQGEDKPPAPPRVQLLVPAYFYPSEEGFTAWNELIAASNQVPVTAILNPANGPGEARDANYSLVLDQAAKSKLRLIGYVHTSYAKRPVEMVKADVDRWLKLYPEIQGIFVDEQTSGPEHVAYYADLYKYIRKQPQLKQVVNNPGTVCDEGYLTKPAADTVCLFEGPKRFDEQEYPKWAASHPPTSVLVLSYKIADAKTMVANMNWAAANRKGWVYITDDDGANPWDRLPTYWKAEIEAVQAANKIPRK